jgi:c-di-GMP-binding flagellar brake protein YcgR
VPPSVERSKIFEAGLAATLEVGGQDDDYTTTIEQVRADVLLVATPMRQREYVRLEQGQRMTLSVVRRNNPYFFETTVVGSETAEGQQMLALRRPADTAGVTLRQQVRVPVSINDALFWWQDGAKFGPSLKGQLVDLSAGGMQVLTRDGLPGGARVLARFALTRELGYLMPDAEVLRDYERVSDVGVKSHRSHLRFVDLPTRDQERLVRFVFQRERELRQKGVL